MADLFTAVMDFLAGLIDILNVFLLPTDPATGAVDWTLLPDQPMKLMVWFALVFMFVAPVLNFILSMILKARRGSA